MSDTKQNIIFPGSGLNTDDAFQYMPTGDARERRNILIGEDETNGLITNMLGCTRTVDIADHELYLSNVYKVIGSYYNRLTRKVYYFIFSQPYPLSSSGAGSSSTSTTTTTTTSGDIDDNLVIDYTSGDFQYDNMLLEYIEDTQELNVIFRDHKNYFGLHFNYPMRDLVMIGDCLYFNPRVSEPKMIDVVRAYNYTNYNAYDATLSYVYGDYVTFYGGLFRATTNIGVGQTPETNLASWDKIGDSYQNETTLSFDSEFRYAFNEIKMPPVVRPLLSYGTDTDIYSNNVRGKMFRFSYRFKYFDNSYSVYSAYSDVSLPTDDEVWNGEILNDVNVNNFIAVTVFLHSAALIKSVEIVFQETGQDWRRCKIVDRIEQAELTTNNFIYNFYNNEAYEVYTDDSEVIKIYDSVPKKANAQEIINKNILCYGGVTEGFDSIPKEYIDVTLTPEAEALATIYDVTAILRDNVANAVTDMSTTEVYDDDEGWQYYTIIDVNNYVAWGVVDGTVYRMIVGGAEAFVTLNAANVASVSALVSAIGGAVGGSFVWGDISHGASGELWVGSLGGYPDVSVSLFYTPAVTASKVTKHRGFKTGAFHPFCLFYYDNPLRRWDAQTSKISENTIGYTYAGTTVYVPMFNEVSPALNENNRYIIHWTVDHLPPEGAKYWRWGYAGNSLCSWFVQYIVEDISTADSMNAIDITALQELKDAGASRNSFPQSIIDPYEWEKGDRIRFLSTQADPTAVPNEGVGDFIEGIYDYEIIKQSDDKLTIYTQEFDYAAEGLSITAGNHLLVEIYRPIKTETHEIFYEFGPLLPIIEDSVGEKMHGGITTNQDSSLNTPATGTFDAGDVYHILRTPSKALNSTDKTVMAFHESQWYSDFYDSDDWDRGKTGWETNFGERYLNIIRYSNPYLQNTLINGLSTFEALNYKELNDVFGDIVAIYEVGDTLKCYQERKASSIQLGRVERTDETGNLYVSASSVVLGSVRYSPTNFSTVFPESIQRNNRYVYGFDIFNGVMWRDSANGIFPISGRFVDAGGDVDYKMATWFKDRSKDLLVSGIGHCDVMSVWDEEFKNLHVTFVDYNNEDNNETIVFHEPSNRWICLEDLHQTPPFYNIMVECDTYTILKGFEGGLGYSFDEDERFAVFEIVSPGNKWIDMDVINLGMTAYTPSVMYDGVPTPDQLGMTMTVYTPSVHVSYILVSVGNMAWDAISYGVSVAWTSVITTTEAFVTVTSIPDWMTGKDETLHTVIAGVTTFANGETITLYPTSPNTGGDKTGDVGFIDSYGNTAIITVTHYGVADFPEVFLQVATGETFTITDSTTSNTYVNVSSTTLHVGFTAHDMVLMNTNLVANVWKNAVWYMSSTVAARNETLVNRTITLGVAAVASDVYLVELTEP